MIPPASTGDEEKKHDFTVFASSGGEDEKPCDDLAEQLVSELESTLQELKMLQCSRGDGQGNDTRKFILEFKSGMDRLVHRLRENPGQEMNAISHEVEYFCDKAKLFFRNKQEMNKDEYEGSRDVLDEELVTKLTFILDELKSLQLSIQEEPTYHALGEGLFEDVANFVHEFSSGMDRLVQHPHQSQEIDDPAAVVEHYHEVARLFLEHKRKRMGALDQYVRPLLKNGFRLMKGDAQACDDKESEQRSSSFYVNLSLMYDEDNTGNELTSVLKHLPHKTKKKKKRKTVNESIGRNIKKQYKWWTDAEVTHTLEEALTRKLCNDGADLIDFEYWIGLLSPRKQVVVTDDDDEDDEEEEDNEDGDDDSTNMELFEKELLLLQSKTGEWSKWEPPLLFENVRTVATPSTIVVEWDSPSCSMDGSADSMDQHITSLFLADDGIGNPIFLDRSLGKTAGYVWTGLEHNTEYIVEVHASSDTHGVSTESSKLTVRTEKVVSLARRIHGCVKDGSSGIGTMPGTETLHLISSFSSSIKSKGIHLPGQATVDCVRFVDVIPGFEPQYEFGNMEDALVCILTGETGAGKSTHLNAIVNWLFGVELEDPFRLLLIDDSHMKATSSVTQHITVYRIRHLPGMPIDKSLMLIDSPGYADSRNLKADDFTTHAFRQLFKEISHVNCVGLVMKAYNERLTASTKYVIEKMLQLFDTSIKDNILPICTFADHGVPTCLEGLKSDNVSFQHHVKVQNSMFSCRYVRSQGEAGPMSSALMQERKLYWQIAYNGISSMFDIVSDHMVLRPLDKSSRVLDQRQKLQETLQAVIHALSETTADVANILQQLNFMVNVLGNVPTEKVKVKKSESVKTDLPTGVHVTLCSKCNVTCHMGCRIPNDQDKARCCAMDKSGNCRVCPGKCYWTHHHNAEYYWEVKTRVEEVVPEELIKRWAGENGSHEAAILNGLKQWEEKQQHVLNLLNLCVSLQEELQVKSLRNNPRVALAYVESLIEMQKDRGATDDVLQALHQAKKQLRLQDESKRQRDINAANKNAFECIKDELDRRSKLPPRQRLMEENQPSDFYNEVLNYVPREYRRDLPPPLKISNHWICGAQSYPPFRESLKKTGLALKTLLSMGVS